MEGTIGMSQSSILNIHFFHYFECLSQSHNRKKEEEEEG